MNRWLNDGEVEKWIKIIRKDESTAGYEQSSADSKRQAFQLLPTQEHRSPNRHNCLEKARPIIIHNFLLLCQCSRDRGTYERTTCRTLEQNRRIPIGFIGSGAS